MKEVDSLVEKLCPVVQFHSANDVSVHTTCRLYVGYKHDPEGRAIDYAFDAMGFASAPTQVRVWYNETDHDGIARFIAIVTGEKTLRFDEVETTKTNRLILYSVPGKDTLQPHVFRKATYCMPIWPLSKKVSKGVIAKPYYFKNLIDNETEISPDCPPSVINIHDNLCKSNLVKESKAAAITGGLKVHNVSPDRKSYTDSSFISTKHSSRNFSDTETMCA